MSAPRPAAFPISPMSRRCAGGRARRDRFTNSVSPRITVIMLLISCAMPPASCPAASSRCACCTRISAARCLVTSVITQTACDRSAQLLGDGPGRHPGPLAVQRDLRAEQRLSVGQRDEGSRRRAW